jgi:hypothetical protein
VRVEYTLHNPRRAAHPGGTWDLGDRGSVLFRELSLGLMFRSSEPAQLHWMAEPDQAPASGTGPLEIYQDSSGGDRWHSRNHVDRTGDVPCEFRGYRIRHAGVERTGNRATPVVAARTRVGTIAAALPEFWQNFPKVIQANGSSLKVGLFPRQSRRAHELLGGEQKTHTLWLHFSRDESAGTQCLSWARQPAWLMAEPEAYGDAGVPFCGLAGDDPDPRFEGLLTQALDGAESLIARREIVDEYGWRHYGELYADHEQTHYGRPEPIISHYNNQYDVVLGTLLHYLRTGDRRWWEIADPLARHVIDIDIYHTKEDKSSYNGGLFWHTDHYKDAATATHRCYSKANRQPGRDYGGGPSNEHNYTSGLLLYYYLTGNPSARDAVLSLANWVIGMDDGRRNVLGMLDGECSGSASSTAQSSYHGPGRGSGNSINALLDGWTLTGDHEYLAKAEALIRRCIHPCEDVSARDLLDVERRWSYTVFLTVLSRYLDLKAEAGQLDDAFAYAQASLKRYAEWMADHEEPYFDHVERLEFPTDTWAAQELRKANVFRLASAHVDEPLRGRLLEKGTQFAERAWSDLLRFTRPATTRALAIVLVEGLKDSAYRCGDQFWSPPLCMDGCRSADFGMPSTFVPQKQRVLARLGTARGLAWAALRLSNPMRWYRFLKQTDQVCP